MKERYSGRRGTELRKDRSAAANLLSRLRERPGEGPAAVRRGKALAGRETASYPGSLSQAKEGGKRQTHARINHRICPAGMQNMTFRDISHGVPQGLMTFHDIS